MSVPKLIRVAGSLYRLVKPDLPPYIRVGGVVYRLAGEMGSEQQQQKLLAKNDGEFDRVNLMLHRLEQATQSEDVKGHIGNMRQVFNKLYQLVQSEDAAQAGPIWKEYRDRLMPKDKSPEALKLSPLAAIMQDKGGAAKLAQDLSRDLIAFDTVFMKWKQLRDQELEGKELSMQMESGQQGVGDAAQAVKQFEEPAPAAQGLKPGDEITMKSQTGKGGEPTVDWGKHKLSAKQAMVVAAAFGIPFTVKYQGSTYRLRRASL
jgi:hypothetical protein